MDARRSPFPFQGPLAPEEVVGRLELRADLARRIRERRLTALLGPRRYGKTSILRRVAADLAADGVETVWVDLFATSSMADLASALDRGLAETQGRFRRALDRLAGSLSLQLGLLGVQLSASARDRPDPAMKVRLMLQLLLEAAQKHDLLLVVDEFSGIAAVPNAAALLRTELQHHYRELGIVFAGSQPSTMAQLFTDRAQPFFAQADLVDTPPLTDPEVAQLVDRGFERTGRHAGPVAGHVVELAAGHPQRAMQLADACWSLVAPGAAATEDTWRDALAEVRRSVDSGSERLFTLLPVGHQKVLRTVAVGGSPLGAAGEVLDLPASTAQAGIRALLGSADLVRRDGRLALVDPLFADWIRRRFPL
ncbi:MAG: ATP-binding protein [Actinobacteria bacterium]|nr:ATP-binding protein [Actinomycetota bacterium]